MNTHIISNKKFLASASLAVIVLLGVMAYGGLHFYSQGTVLPNFIAPPNNNAAIVKAGAGLPVKLTIPSVGINANIIQVGLDANGAVGTPKGPYEVAWYKLGPRPGDKGSAVFTGHFGQWVNGAHSVFDNLNKVKVGDKVYVKDAKGNTLTFKVTAIKEYDPNANAPEIFNKNDGIYLNLITCQGNWVASQKTYTKRLVVFTELVR